MVSLLHHLLVCTTHENEDGSSKVSWTSGLESSLMNPCREQIDYTYEKSSGKCSCRYRAKASQQTVDGKDVCTTL